MNGSAPQMNGHSEDVPDIYLLDLIDLGCDWEPHAMVKAGRVLRFEPRSRKMTTILSGLPLPDGLDISRSAGRLFFTNMGTSPAVEDGSVQSCRLDGSDVQTLLRSGAVHTPKQAVICEASQRLYFCDREGMSVHRIGLDGTNHEVLVRTGSGSTDRADMTRWCVGIVLDQKHGYVYWTQKGPSKANRGRIFRAGIDIPSGQTADDRRDIELVLDRLPEPIDLEYDHEGQVLYWTDRGEYPFGCSLNRLDLTNINATGGPLQVDALKKKMVILARHFHEPIGLRLDRRRKVVYMADLGGGVYEISLDGTKTVLYQSECCYTGVAI